MRLERRAVIFDLDDTLHPRRHFVASGPRAVAVHVASAYAMSRGDALRVLARARRESSGRELQALQEAFGLPADTLPALIAVVRAHVPRLRLSTAARAVLAHLRAAWRLGVVTNGVAEVQARKVAALGLAAHVDCVVYATADGQPGKPDPAPFLDACARLDVAPAQTVFVGDDLRADIAGAAAVGMKTIWIAPPRLRGAGGPDADITVHALDDVPAAARRLLPSRWSPYAA